jgi:hypothetical protein
MSAGVGGPRTRGCAWNRWDPHIHTRGTVLNDRRLAGGRPCQQADPTGTGDGAPDPG